MRALEKRSPVRTQAAKPRGSHHDRNGQFVIKKLLPILLGKLAPKKAFPLMRRRSIAFPKEGISGCHSSMCFHETHRGASLGFEVHVSGSLQKRESPLRNYGDVKGKPDFRATEANTLCRIRVGRRSGLRRRETPGPSFAIDWSRVKSAKPSRSGRREPRARVQVVRLVRVAEVGSHASWRLPAMVGV